ncbi:MAG TPA: hypothetical protein VGA08_02500 [Candidatus Saccharimonadales bacterium]
MATKTDQPPDTDPNPIQDDYDQKFNDKTAPENYANTAKEPDLQNKEDAAADQTTSGKTASSGLAGLEQGFYSQSPQPKAKKRLSLRKSWKRYALISSVVGLVVGGFGLIITSLLPLKFSFIFENLDDVTNVNMNSIFDRRSDKYKIAYLRARLMEFDKPGTSEWFRARSVDTDRPLTDWYRTLRTSDFEARVFNDHGTFFETRAGPDGRPQLARITVGDDFGEITAREFRAGEITANNIEGFTDELFDSDKAARRAIKETVNDNTRWFQVIKRHNVRRNLQNMNGVRRWRFFEGTREKLEVHRRNFRIKLWEGIKTSLRSGLFIGCLFSNSRCSNSSDPVNPKNDSLNLNLDGSVVGEDFGDQACSDTRTTNCVPGGDSDNRPLQKEIQEEIDNAAKNAGTSPDTPSSPRKVLVAKIASKLLGVINLADTLDVLVSIHNNFLKGTFSKMITVARAAQYTAVYTQFKIMSDQIISGEDVSGEELTAAYESLEGFEASEAHQVLIEKRPIDQAKKADWCELDQARIEAEEKIKNKPTYQYFCDDQKADATKYAKTIEATYNNSVGILIQPIASTYGFIISIPIFGDLVEAVIDLFNTIAGGVINFVLSLIPGAQAGIEWAVGWITERVLAFFGGSPIVDGTQQGGELTNILAAGSIITAENTLRFAGARAATEEDRAYVEQLATRFDQERQDSSDLTGRIFALDNPRSLIARLIAISPTSYQSTLSGIASLLSPAKLIASAYGNVAASVWRPVYAQSVETPTEFAGTTQYAFPESVLEMDPADVTPQNCSNVHQVLRAAGASVAEAGQLVPLSWELLTDQDAFWNATHSALEKLLTTETELKEYDDYAQSIYNLCLLDAQVMNSMASLFTDADDGGL